MSKTHKSVVNILTIFIIGIILVAITFSSFNSIFRGVSTSLTICTSCTQNTLHIFYQNITVNELKEMINKKVNITIIDVRTLEEYANGHIPGAINIPLHELPLKIAELKEKKIVVYCNSGVRSKVAAEILSRNGIQKVWNLAGGLNAWINAGFSIEK